MTFSPGLLLMMAFPMLAGLAGAALLISNAQAAQRRVAARLAKVVPTAALPATRHGRISREADAPGGPTGLLAALFGCNWARRRHYPVRWWIVLLGAVGVGRVAVLMVQGLLGSVAMVFWPVAAIAASRMLFGGWDAKRRARLLEQFPDALAMIVRTVRVGVPVAEGVALVGREAEEPTGSEFRLVANEINIGVPLSDALQGLAARTGMTEYRFFATTVALQAQTGGGLSEALETLAEVVRKRVALRARGYALSSEARTSALVLSAMPFLVGAALMAITPDYMTPMFTTEFGYKALGLAALMLTVGTLVMRVLIRRTLA